MDNKVTEVKLAFSAINQRLVDSIPSSEEIKGTTYVAYGKRNDYPNFIFDSYSKCPSLQTIVNGLADYVVGDGVSCSVMEKPNRNDTWDELFNHLSADYWLYGIAYLQVVRAYNGNPTEFYWLDSMYVRSDENGESFYYNEDFGKNYVKTQNTIVYPKYKKDINTPSSVIAIKTPLGKGVYGSPLWGSGIKSVLTEIAIDDFHLNEIENGFFVSSVINFNNGVPSDEDKDEIERLVTKKFTGHENAGRFLLSFNNGKDNATTVEKLTTDDFDKRYESLANKTQKQIFTAFGVSPVIFGVEKESTGFNDEDYMQAFKLANRTRIQPVQRRLIDVFDNVFGQKGSITIKPFSIDWSEDENNEIVN